MWAQVSNLTVSTMYLALSTMYLALLLGQTNCGSPAAHSLVDLPPRATSATLVGPLCEGESCQCRAPDKDPGLPERPGWKRYEIAIGPADNELWVTINSMVLYKGVERAQECFYIDLPAGKHPVLLRAGNANGMTARLEISEIGAQGSYDTIHFACGSPGPCTLEDLSSWHASLARFQRGAHDPCGSTKIREVQWRSGESPDRVHPNQLQVELVLHVYDFVPRHPPGHPACAGKL